LRIIILFSHKNNRCPKIFVVFFRNNKNIYSAEFSSFTGALYPPSRRDLTHSPAITGVYFDGRSSLMQLGKVYLISKADKKHYIYHTFVISSEKIRYRISFHPRAINDSMNRALEYIVRPSSHAVGNIYHQRSLL
jgi:hypothetical protein